MAEDDRHWQSGRQDRWQKRRKAAPVSGALPPGGGRLPAEWPAVQRAFLGRAAGMSCLEAWEKSVVQAASSRLDALVLEADILHMIRNHAIQFSTYMRDVLMASRRPATEARQQAMALLNETCDAHTQVNPRSPDLLSGRVRLDELPAWELAEDMEKSLPYLNLRQYPAFRESMMEISAEIAARDGAGHGIDPQLDEAVQRFAIGIRDSLAHLTRDLDRFLRNYAAPEAKRHLRDIDKIAGFVWLTSDMFDLRARLKQFVAEAESGAGPWVQRRNSLIIMPPPR